MSAPNGDALAVAAAQGTQRIEKANAADSAPAAIAVELTRHEAALVVTRVAAALARLGDAADDPIVVANVIADEVAVALDYRRGPSTCTP